MLPTTAQFDAAVDANTTEVDCIVHIEREYNAIADSISVSAVHDPVDERFDKDNVVNIRNPKFNGIAYGPVREFFSSSTPLHGFRFIDDVDFDEDTSVAYYIPVNSPDTTRADVTVDYTQNYEMNCIEVRYENTRTQSTRYDDTIEIYVTPDGGAETQVYTSTMKSDGVTRIYYDGSAWTETEADMVQGGVNLREVRLRVQQGTYLHQPRIMYVGGLNIVDASDDIIDVSLDKTEFEQSSYLPIGEPSGNTCNISLDNTAMNYRFGSSISSNYFLENQKVTVKLGVNTKYGGGADSFEYVYGGVFYVDSYGYDEKEMTANISAQDFSKFLQKTFCGNYVWRNKSLKFIVYDVLARSGISPKNVDFDFGVAGNADESNKRPYTWSTDEQTVWDFLSTLAKSELGTVFYDEQGNLVFTDRLDLDDKNAAGSQYTFDASVNLESIDEKFQVGANKIKVSYEELEVNSSKVNPQLVRTGDNQYSYEQGPEVMLNQVLWQPDDEESYLGSAVLSRTLNPSDTHIFISKDTSVQITRDEGEVLIGDEFIKYKNRTDLPNTESKLEIVERDARNTVYGGVIPVYKGQNSGYNFRKSVKYARSLFPSGPPPANRRITQDGYRQWIHEKDSKHRNTVHCTEFESQEIDYETKYRIYGARFRFNDIPAGFRSDQAAGLFINNNSDSVGIHLEISRPLVGEIVYGSLEGNLRAYKINNALSPVPMPPEGYEEGFEKTVLFDEADRSHIGDDGTYLDMTIIQIVQSGYDDIIWYVNGERVAKFQTAYGTTYLSGLGYSGGRLDVGSSLTEKGRFGFFTRGSTDATLDFIYASNDTSIGPDELLQSRGFNKYFDSHTETWKVKRDYLKGREYYVEFGTPVHEVVEFEVDHDTFPNIYARIMNTDEDTVSVFKSSHDPFGSKIIVGNTSRVGVDLNNTVYYPDGTSLNHSFLVYGVAIVRAESDTITTMDAASIRRYGVEEVEFVNPWVNSRSQAVALAQDIRRFWSSPQQFFDLQVMPNPALQVRDRVTVLHPDKGFDGSGVWFVNGIQITYDGGLSGTVRLKRYDEYPPDAEDYREEGGIIL